MGNDADQKEKYGEKVTYLKAAVERINEAIKLLKVSLHKVQHNFLFIFSYCERETTTIMQTNSKSSVQLVVV